MIDVKTSADFERLLKALSDDIVDAHIHHRLYQDLVEALEKHPLVFPQSRVFWDFTLQAHVNSSVYALSRAYDQDSRSLHLRSWLVTIQENLQLFNDAAFRERLKDNPYVASLAQDRRKPDPLVLAQDIGACSATDATVKKLMIYRSNRVAHRSATYVLSALHMDEKYGLTFEELRALLSRARTILNRYAYLFAAGVYSTTIVGHDDFEYIIKTVQEKVEESRREWGLGGGVQNQIEVEPMTAGQKAAMTRRRRQAAGKAARTRKLRAAGRKAAVTRKRRAAARKAAATRAGTK